MAPAGRPRRGPSPASSSPEWVFAHVNTPGASPRAGRRGARERAPPRRVDRHPAGLRAQLAAAVESLAPARACTSVDHPNLAAWQQVLLELEGNPAREAEALFVADLDDPVTSEADGSMRATFEGHAPAPLSPGTRGRNGHPSVVGARGRVRRKPPAVIDGP